MTMVSKQLTEDAQASANAELIDAETHDTLANLLRPDHALMRMENETMMSESRMRPRDMKAIKAELLEGLDLFPAMAEKAIYNKPVGRITDKTSKRCGEMQFARGLSVRAAEVFAEAYGFNRVRIEISPMDEGGKSTDATSCAAARVEAVFNDYQRVRIWQNAGVVSKFYKAKGGVNAKWAEDRFWGLVVKAEASRQVREVILRSVNPALKAWYEEECETRLLALLDDDAVDRIVNKFAGRQVSLEQLEELLGRKKSLGWTGEDRQVLLGVWNSIEHEGESIDVIMAASRLHDGVDRPSDAKKEPPQKDRAKMTTEELFEAECTSGPNPHGPTKPYKEPPLPGKNSTEENSTEGTTTEATESAPGAGDDSPTLFP